MKRMEDEFISKISNRCSKIAVIGLGYVGLPLAMCFCQKGFSVYGLDIDQVKVEMLLKGKSYLKHIDSKCIEELVRSERFLISNDFSLIREADAIIMCVPTPLNLYREPDLSYIINTMDEVAPFLHKGQIVSLESTTYPGTTDEIIRTKIEEKGFKIGEDIFLVFSPEREDPGNRKFSTSTIPKVVGGTTANCLKVGIALYNSIIDKVVPISSTRAAEMTKLLENIYRAVNIGLVNEMKIVADKMGIDIWEVIDAAATKPFGFIPFYPGPGLGGHCIPIDPFYLTWKAREYDVHTRFIELAGEINTFMPEWVVGKVADALNERCKSIKKSKILVVGIAYKKNVDDMRESPAVHLLKLLQDKGADICYHDPYIPKFPKIRKYSFDLKSIELNKMNLDSVDCILIATDHDCIDYDLIKKYGALIVDTRGRYRHHANNVVRC